MNRAGQPGANRRASVAPASGSYLAAAGEAGLFVVLEGGATGEGERRRLGPLEGDAGRLPPGEEKRFSFSLF